MRLAGHAIAQPRHGVTELVERVVDLVERILARLEEAVLDLLEPWLELAPLGAHLHAGQVQRLVNFGKSCLFLADAHKTLAVTAAVGRAS